MEWMMFFLLTGFVGAMSAAILAKVDQVHKDVKELKERLKQ